MHHVPRSSESFERKATGTGYGATVDIAQRECAGLQKRARRRTWHHSLQES
jgi:hypothetical protein